MGRDKKPTGRKQEAAAPELLPSYIKSGHNGVSLTVRAKPGSKIRSISLSDTAVEVSVDAPARDGEANEGIVEYLAEVLGVRKREISLSVGSKSRDKVLLVTGLSANDALHRLQAASAPPPSH
eukprot:jgi/Botrbrau1/7095/Bobra.0165s0117.1